MKVIFLDMDGVTVTSRSCFDDKGINGQVDPIAIGMINYFCARFGAKIVFSTSWRKLFDTSSLRHILKAAGIKDEHFWENPEEMFTPVLSGPRGLEINAWLKAHPEVTNYVILDDGSDMLPDQKSRFVKTDEYNGISFKNFQQCRQILGNP